MENGGGTENLFPDDFSFSNGVFGGSGGGAGADDAGAGGIGLWPIRVPALGNGGGTANFGAGGCGGDAGGEGAAFRTGERGGGGDEAPDATAWDLRAGGGGGGGPFLGPLPVDDTDCPVICGLIAPFRVPLGGGMTGAAEGGGGGGGGGGTLTDREGAIPIFGELDSPTPFS